MLVDVEGKSIHVTLNINDANEFRIFNLTVTDTGMPTIRKFFQEFPFMCEAFHSDMSTFSTLLSMFKSWRNQKAYSVNVMTDFLSAYCGSPNKMCLLHCAPTRIVFMSEFLTRLRVFGHCELRYKNVDDFKPKAGTPYVEQFADFLISRRVIGIIDRDFFVETFAKINSNHHKHHPHITIGDYL